MVGWRMRLPNGFVGPLLLLAVAGAGDVEAQPLLPSGPEIPVSLSGGVQGSFSAARFPDGGFVTAGAACAPGSAGGPCLIPGRRFRAEGAPRSAGISLLRP